MVTVTFTVPVPDGAMTVSESPPPATLMEVPGFEGPKSTAVAPVKPVPLIVTGVAAGRWPVGRADRGDRRRRVIGEVVARRIVAEVPLAVVTVTSTVPVPDGAMTVSELAPTPR